MKLHFTGTEFFRSVDLYFESYLQMVGYLAMILGETQHCCCSGFLRQLYISKGLEMVGYSALLLGRERLSYGCHCTLPGQDLFQLVDLHFSLG